jgi:hypothetical protein
MVFEEISWHLNLRGGRATARFPYIEIRLSEILELFPAIRCGQCIVESGLSVVGDPRCLLLMWAGGIIRRDSPGRSAENRRAAFRQAAQTISKIAKMVLTMIPKNSGVLPTHGAMMRPSAALWQSVPVM